MFARCESLPVNQSIARSPVCWAADCSLGSSIELLANNWLVACLTSFHLLFDLLASIWLDLTRLDSTWVCFPLLSTLTFSVFVWFQSRFLMRYSVCCVPSARSPVRKLAEWVTMRALFSWASHLITLFNNHLWLGWKPLVASPVSCPLNRIHFRSKFVCLVSHLKSVSQQADGTKIKQNSQFDGSMDSINSTTIRLFIELDSCCESFELPTYVASVGVAAAAVVEPSGLLMI